MKSLRFFLPLLILALLAGCGTLGGGEKPRAPSVERGEPATPAEKPAATPGKGGYYLDDGPGDSPPSDIDDIPDAVPTAEPPLTRANRPYLALGERYTPMTAHQPYRASGVASWYGRRYHGNKTASGEVYDMYGMTAAHPTLPIPSYVRVTNPENGRAVVVRVNDRGPFKKDRLIDLSYAAAYKLRLIDQGSGPVEVEAIAPVNAAAKPAEPVLVAETSISRPPAAAGSYVQIGAFRMKQNADQLQDRLRQQNLVGNVAVESWYNDGVYRVRIGPYASRSEAERAAGEVRQSLGLSTLVITQ